VGDFVSKLASGLVGKTLSKLAKVLAVTATSMSLGGTGSLFHGILLYSYTILVGFFCD